MTHVVFTEDTDLISVCIKGEGGWCLVKVPNVPVIEILHSIARDEAVEQGCLPPLIPNDHVTGCNLVFSVLSQAEHLYNKLFENGVQPDVAR